MDYQKVFDRIAKHLLTQNVKSADDGMCLYKSIVDGKTCKCAIGCLIPDDRYHDRIEGKPMALTSVDTDGNNIVLINPIGSDSAYLYNILIDEVNHGDDLKYEELSFLDGLREIHDWSPVDRWRDDLIEFAKDNGLTFNA